MGSALPRDVWLPRLVDWLQDGRTLREFCAQKDVPTEGRVRSCLREWCSKDPAVDAEVQSAREAGYDTIAEKILEIVDDTLGDPDPASRRVRAWARLELLKRWWPQRYGDQTQAKVSGGITIQIDTGVPPAS